MNAHAQGDTREITVKVGYDYFQCSVFLGAYYMVILQISINATRILAVMEACVQGRTTYEVTLVLAEKDLKAATAQVKIPSIA